jgi:predicted metal-dependent phosphoesterase TrpH
MHTYYSDGRASPAEVVHHAASIGLRIIAITDHDTLGGISEARHVAKELGVDLIPAVELTTNWSECYPTDGLKEMEADVDLLGYYVDSDQPAFRAFVDEAALDIRQRIKECCKLLTKNGYPLTIQDVLAYNPRYPGGVQTITALWKKGYAKSYNEAFLLFLEAWHEVRLSRLTTTRAIEAIHEAGGAAVLAHPVKIRCGDGLIREDHLAHLVDAGLDGLEVFHPRLSYAERQHFLELAKKFSLVVSGGSDEHGLEGRFTRMGSQPVSYEIVRHLEARARDIRQKTKG